MTTFNKISEIVILFLILCFICFADFACADDDLYQGETVNPRTVAVMVPNMDLCKVKCFNFEAKRFVYLEHCGIDHVPDNPIYDEDYIIIGLEECEATFPIIYPVEQWLTGF